MSVPINDTIVFVNVYQYAQRQIEPELGSRAFQRLTEKELSSVVIVQRFEKECDQLVELARKVEPTPEGYPLPEGLRYAHFGNLEGEERLLREVESDWGSLLANATTLEDLVCAAAQDLAHRGIAWAGYESKEDGTTPSDRIGRRREVKRRLRKDYEDAKHDLGPMRWVSRHRNASAHEHYFFADVVQGAGEVVFTQTSDDFASKDHTNPEALTAKRLIQAVRSLHGFIGWFVAESLRQARQTTRGQGDTNSSHPVPHT